MASARSVPRHGPDRRGGGSPPGCATRPCRDWGATSVSNSKVLPSNYSVFMRVGKSHNRRGLTSECGTRFEGANPMNLHRIFANLAEYAMQVHGVCSFESGAALT